jgi:hypothetical protein
MDGKTAYTLYFTLDTPGDPEVDPEEYREDIESTPATIVDDSFKRTCDILHNGLPRRVSIGKGKNKRSETITEFWGAVTLDNIEEND